MTMVWELGSQARDEGKGIGGSLDSKEAEMMRYEYDNIIHSSHYRNACPQALFHIEHLARSLKILSQRHFSTMP